tara:strand:+ start:4495 stop:5268 length:774 start_codon:yes stop_codon:yes gene_type:complete
MSMRYLKLMKFRLIEQETHDAKMNMALDHILLDSSPAIRFYKWKNNSISLGAYQNSEEVNLKECKKNNIEIVRRLTGGGAVLHTQKDLTYSFIAPIKLFNNDVSKAYTTVCSWIISALSNLGISSVIKNKNDLMINNKKISGNAAKIEGGIYLQHGTIIYDLNASLMPTLLNISKQDLLDNITSIKKQKDISQEELYQSLKSSFSKDKDISISKITSKEKTKAKKLIDSNYNNLDLNIDTSKLKFKGACFLGHDILN